MAAFGLPGGAEWLICCAPFLLLLIAAFALLIWTLARRRSDKVPSQKRCATCDQMYDAVYDSCPHCARR